MEEEIFILAGEPSGDVVGSGLVDNLKNLMPNTHLWGVGGPKMRASGLEAQWGTEDLSVMGFTDVIKAYPRLRRLFYEMRNEILRRQPKAVVFIDYPGFNLRLQKALRRKGFKGQLIQYICPTVWLWGKGRIPLMEKNLDLLLAIFPFEQRCFKSGTLDVQFVGHPIAWDVQQQKNQPSRLHPDFLSDSKPVLGLFPGSRRSEISFNLERLLLASKRLQQDQPDLQLALSLASPALENQIHNVCQKAGVHPTIIPGEFRYDLMRASKVALGVSGTVTLELALHSTPTVVVYDTTRFNRFVAQYFFRLKLPFYCMVNIIAEQEVFPEFMAQPYDVETLVRSASNLLRNPEARRRAKEGCGKVQQLLQSHDPNAQAAKIVQQQLAR